MVAATELPIDDTFECGGSLRASPRHVAPCHWQIPTDICRVVPALRSADRVRLCRLPGDPSRRSTAALLSVT